MINTRKQIQKSGNQSVNLQTKQIIFNLNFPFEKNVQTIRDNDYEPYEIEKIVKHIINQSNSMEDSQDDKKYLIELSRLSNDIETYIKRGKVQDAKNKLHEIERELKNIKEDELYHRDNLLGFFHFIDAHCCRISGEYIESIKECDHALRFFEEDESMTIRTYNLLADNQRLKSNYNKSLEFYEKVISFYKNSHNNKNYRELNKALLGIAKLNRLKCDYKKSLEFYKKAFKEFDAFKDTAGISEAFFGMGEIHRLLNNHSESLLHYKVSLDKAIEDKNLERQAYSLWGIGEILRITGRSEEAEENHLQGIEFCKIIGDTRSNGWGLLGMAEIDSRKGYYDKSMNSYLEALSLFESTDSKTEIAHSFLGIAESNRMQGKVDIESYDKAIKIYKERKMEHCLIYARVGKLLSLQLQKRKILTKSLTNFSLMMLKRHAHSYNLAKESCLISKMLNEINPYEKIELNFP